MPKRRHRLTRLCALLAAACLLLTAAVISAQEDGASLTLAEYQAQLAAAYSDLTAGAPLTAVQQQLARIEEVRLENGNVVNITPILDEVGDTDAALQRLEIGLTQMEQLAQDRSSERIAQLQHVRDRYELDRPSFWDRIWRWISDLFDALFPDDVPQGVGAVAEIGSRIVVWAIVISGGALLAILLSYWLRGLLGGILGNRLRRRTANDAEIPATAADARSQAQTLAGAGNYRAAVRQLYLAALLHLDEQGLLRFQRDQTNREVLAQTKPGTDVHAHLKPAVETFDRVWYGEQEPDRPTFEAYSAEIDELMTQTAEDKRA